MTLCDLKPIFVFWWLCFDGGCSEEVVLATAFTCNWAGCMYACVCVCFGFNGWMLIIAFDFDLCNQIQCHKYLYIYIAPPKSFYLKCMFIQNCWVSGKTRTKHSAMRQCICIWTFSSCSKVQKFRPDHKSQNISCSAFLYWPISWPVFTILSLVSILLSLLPIHLFLNPIASLPLSCPSPASLPATAQYSHLNSILSHSFAIILY